MNSVSQSSWVTTEYSSCKKVLNLHYKQFYNYWGSTAYIPFNLLWLCKGRDTCQLFAVEGFITYSECMFCWVCLLPVLISKVSIKMTKLYSWCSCFSSNPESKISLFFFFVLRYVSHIWVNFTCLEAEYTINLLFVCLDAAFRISDVRDPCEKVLNFSSNATTRSIHAETHN